jgi:glucose-6-phosphate-specific signal transduction histidine kinase
VTDEGPKSLMAKDVVLSRQGSGHGLIGMRERSALFGGSLQAGSYGPGFRARAELHISDLDAGDHRVEGTP